MSDVIQDQVETYRERMETLYAEVQMWVAPLSTKVYDVQVSEQAPGAYTAQCLKIQAADGSDIARLEPAGAWIIGAEGRVDLKGHYGKEVIIYLTNNEPTLNFDETAGEETTKSSMTLFQGVDEDGWYWIEDSRRGRAKLMDRELFRDLVSEVSDYAFA